MSLPIATEYEEHVAVVAWLQLNNIAHWHTPNSTYTKSFNQKRRNKALGVVAGVPDLFVALPGVGIIALELKRRKLGVVSQAQKDWLEILNSCPGTQAFICRGSDVAIAIIADYAHLPTPTYSNTTF